MKMTDMTVLITGATSGIGKAAARLFLQEGARVTVNYHSDDEKRDDTEREFRALLRAAGRPEDDLVMAKADVSKDPEVAVMFEKSIQRFGRLDILINNAGMAREAPSHEVELDDLFKQLDVNLRGAILCSIHAVRHFLERGQGGCILNNSSVHETIPKPGFLAYAVAKAGMRGLTRTLALEYASKGIRVNAVGPGAVETPMNAGVLDDEESRKTIESHVPLGKVIQPEEIAQAFLYLASEAARNITGQTLFIDGGLTLYPEFRENWSSP